VIEISLSSASSSHQKSIAASSKAAGVDYAEYEYWNGLTEKRKTSIRLNFFSGNCSKDGKTCIFRTVAYTMNDRVITGNFQFNIELATYQTPRRDEKKNALRAS
jgi:hypothetical protein